MSRSNATESDDGVLSANSTLSNDGDNFGGSCNESIVLKKGPWTSGEDAILVDYVKKHGEGNWNAVQKHAGLSRCGKSCRLRWANHLRPNLKKGAFTSEEEQLIIELHAKMGNKWARMAANLPGRTDNEIKNYWNTRIKRRQRAGLPLYPPDLYLHAVPENEQPLTPPGIFIRDSSCHDIQNIVYGTSDIMSENYNILPHHPEYGTSPSLPKEIGFSSPQVYSYPTHVLGAPKRVQGLDEPISVYRGGHTNATPPFDRTQTNSYEDSVSLPFGMTFPRDLDHKRKLLPFGVNQDGYFVPNDIFSASKHFTGAQKLELPSLQYQETSSGFWNLESKSSDSVIQHSLSEPHPQNGPYPRCSGLLEDLLYEAKALNKSENHSSDWATSSNISHGDVTESSALKTCSTEFNDYLDPSSPHDNSSGSNFNVCSLTGHAGSSSQDTPVHHPKSEAIDQSWMSNGEMKNILDDMDYSRADAILESCWAPWISPFTQQRGSTADTIAALLGDDMEAVSQNGSSTLGALVPALGITCQLPAKYPISLEHWQYMIDL